MPAHITKRQPVSCENCRKRKIKCAGERRPCSTCIRRGFGHSCQYARDSSAPIIASQGGIEECLQRLKRLEELLEQQFEDSSSSQLQHDSQPWSNFDEHLIPGETLSQNSSIGPSPSQSHSSILSGSIMNLPGGYQRFVPGTFSSDGFAINELVQSASSPISSFNFPFTTDGLGGHQTLLDALPPTRQCEELKSIFFEVFSPLFHILHDPSFDQAYAKFRQNPQETQLSFLALLFVILSIAVTALDEDHPLLQDLGRESTAAANVKNLAGRYRSAAMKCLSSDQFLWQHTLYTVQALVLLIYAINHAHGPAWALLGTTLNISVAIGCHIDPIHLEGLGKVESEERRRCWAALMMLYTIQNTCLGNISPQKMIATVQLPADLNDEDLIDHPQSSLSHEQSTAVPTKMSYILYKFRLYQIAAEICQLTERHPDRLSILKLDKLISKEDDEHSLRFSHIQDLPLCHLAHHYILKNYTNHLRLILYRPYLTSKDYGTQSSESVPLEGFMQIHDLCRRSAIIILENHEQLYQIDALKPYRWYIYGLGSFHAFLAASTLIMILTIDLEMSEESKQQAITVLQKCQQRLDNMAIRSEICAKASPILTRLLQTSGVLTKEFPNLQHSNIDGNVLISPLNQRIGTSESSISEGLVPAQQQFTLFDPQLQTLLQLPPEQWLGGPSGFSWDGWNSESFFENSSIPLDSNCLVGPAGMF